MTAWSGTLPTFASMQPPTATEMDELVGAVHGLTDAWTSYAPSWTASVNPAIGNGTMVGAYIRTGKFVVATIGLTMGSTTTYGTGTWLFSLPITAAATTMHIGTALIYDASVTTNRRAGAVYLSSTSVVAIAADGDVGAAVPFTWTTSDVLRFTITYEAA